MRAEVDSPTYLAGLFAPSTCAIVHPARLVFELARACAEKGVQIYEHTAAQSVERDRRRGAGATPAAASITADRVVLATNVFPSLLRRNRLLHRAGVRLRAGHRAADRRPTRPHRLARPARASATAPTSSTTTGSPPTTGSCGAATTRSTTSAAGSTRCTRTARSPSASSPRTSSSPSRNSTTSGSATAGPGRSTPTPGSARTGGWPARGRIAYVNGFTGLGVGAGPVRRRRLPGSARRAAAPSAPSWRWSASKPLPFPPEPVASIGIQATRWSLDRADHHGGRRNLLLRTLDRLGLGFDS